MSASFKHARWGLPLWLGFALAIGGATTYLVGTLLGPGQSLAGLIVRGIPESSPSLAASAILAAFWTAALVLIISVVGLRGDRRGLWAFALFGAAAIWARGAIFVVLLSGLGGFGYGSIVQYAGRGIAFLGGLLALISVRRAEHTPGDDEVITREGLEVSVPGLAVFGFALALGGALVVVVSSFLPYTRIESLIPGFLADGVVLQPGASATYSRYHELLGHGIHQGIVAFLAVYGNSVIVGALAFAALAARRFDRWGLALAGAAAAWVVPLLASFAAAPNPAPSAQSGYREFVMIGIRGAEIGELLVLVGAMLALGAMGRRRFPLSSGDATEAEYRIDASGP